MRLILQLILIRCSNIFFQRLCRFYHAQLFISLGGTRGLNLFFVITTRRIYLAVVIISGSNFLFFNSVLYRFVIIGHSFNNWAVEIAYTRDRLLVILQWLIVVDRGHCAYLVYGFFIERFTLQRRHDAVSSKIVCWSSGVTFPAFGYVIDLFLKHTTLLFFELQSIHKQLVLGFQGGDFEAYLGQLKRQIYHLCLDF